MSLTVLLLIAVLALLSSAAQTRRKKARRAHQRKNQIRVRISGKWVDESVIIAKSREEEQYRILEAEVLDALGFDNRDAIACFDVQVIVKSRQALENYDEIKYFKENREMLGKAADIIERKKELVPMLQEFLANNKYETRSQFDCIAERINAFLKRADAFNIKVSYISSARNYLDSKEITVNQCDISRFQEDPSLLMGKGEYNKYIKDQQKEALNQKRHAYYARINHIIDYANANRDALLIKDTQKQLDSLIDQLFDRTVNSIKRIKAPDSEEWMLIESFMKHLEREIMRISKENQRIQEYYKSPDFLKTKEACEVLMSSQREFNEYIDEKVHSIAQLFGTRVIRNETIHNDEYNYIRPYKKTITPFTADVSAAVFASAENSPLEYVAKYFYPNKNAYPEQIQKLYQLVEELETLRDAKRIIENYKAEYQQYLGDVPDFVMENDEAGFYSRLGFATIDESVLTVEYKFAYTSGGGMAQRSFTVPMTEETIAELIKVLESKLTATAFAKEQRVLMTKKLRESIKNRDNFTCCNCGNSIYHEPNLLLEIDHIIPVAKGGRTTEDNLQTLCWKCNRVKSDKLESPRLA